MALSNCFLVDMKKLKRLYQEFFIAFTLGSIPSFIAFLSGGLEMLDTSIKASLPPDNVLWYLAALSWFYLIAVAFDRYVWKRTEKIKARAAFWRSTWTEAGTALHALWRVLAGSCFGILIIWFLHEPETFKLSNVGFFIAGGFILLIQCWFFSLGRGWLEGHTRQ